jgi:hypothetical protein
MPNQTLKKEHLRVIFGTIDML